MASLLKQHFGVTLEQQEVLFKGWNWGITDFRGEPLTIRALHRWLRWSDWHVFAGEDLAFLVSNKTAFELQLQHVANSNIAGRTEVSLEFASPSDEASSSSSKKPSKSAPDEMVEIRFFVPGTTSTRQRTGSDAGSQKSDAEDEDGEEVSAAQVFHDAIKEKAGSELATGEKILSFEEVLVLTPRGRYDVDMFPEFLRLRGKTYDYKIVYTSISRLFLLPKDDLHVLFIVRPVHTFFCHNSTEGYGTQLSLITPIRQGQTRYQYLVMQFSREEEITAELNMDECVKISIHTSNPLANIYSARRLQSTTG